MSYLLDTNVFIQAKNLHYGFDFCPAFWEWLDHAHERGDVFSVDAVRGEIIGGGDDLAEWARTRTDGFFLKPDSPMLGGLRTVSGWAQTARYDASAVSAFLQDADYYLIGHAQAHGHTVVTHEVVSNSTKRIKIPDVCIELDIPCTTPFAMLRTEKASFVLGR